MADQLKVLDKSWLFESSTSIKFQGGLNSFLDFAEIYSNHKMEPGLKLPCPCSKCHNDKYYNRKTISEHIILFSFDNAYRYKTWYMHGELIPGSRAYKKAVKRKNREIVCATNTAESSTASTRFSVEMNRELIPGSRAYKKAVKRKNHEIVCAISTAESSTASIRFSVEKNVRNLEKEKEKKIRNDQIEALLEDNRNLKNKFDQLFDMCQELFKKISSQSNKIPPPSDHGSLQDNRNGAHSDQRYQTPPSPFINFNENQGKS